ncbi:MAG: hypothetical protein Q8O42_09480 [Acidobacteriota bacterium]|nr:hypothetical protein [Acidobacteriota bacterium]
MMYGNYGEYFHRRWAELRIPEQSLEIAVAFGLPADPGAAQKAVNAWFSAGDPRGPQIGKQLRHLQGAAFILIAGELHHVEGHADVGLGRKPGGTRITLPDGTGVAEDVIVLRPIDTNGQVVAEEPVWQGDVITSMAGVNPVIDWGPLEEPNAERAWVRPPAPGAQPVPVEPVPVPTPTPQPPAIVLPGREEMMNAGQALHFYYRAPEGLQRPDGLWKPETPHSIAQPDWEGIGAWLFDVYLQARIAGKNATEATQAVISQIRQTDEWQQKHPGETP